MSVIETTGQQRQRQTKGFKMLWLLQRKGTTKYDEHAGFVVRANSEAQARAFAQQRAGPTEAKTWEDPKKSYCARLLSTGKTEVVLADFNAA